MLVYFLYCSEFRNELTCADFSDSLDPGYIVRRVTAYGQYLNDLLRSGDVVFLADFLYVNDLIV